MKEIAMDKCIRVFCALALIAGVATIVMGGKPPVDQAGSAVKVLFGAGHGSGVHIGNGYVLTAAHVTADAKAVKLKTDRGESVDAEVLWSNRDYDLTLLRAGEPKIASSRLSCSDPAIGEPVTTIGNPGELEFMRSFGTVSSDVRERKPFRSAFIADLTASFGMSGGGVFDSRGSVVGLVNAVALATMQMGMFPTPSVLRFSYVVPGSAICTLLSR